MRNSNRILIAALAIAAAQFPALGARAELAPQHQAALQQVVDAYEAAASALQTEIDNNPIQNLQNGEILLFVNFAEAIGNAENSEELNLAGYDFTNAVYGVSGTGIEDFMSEETVNQIKEIKNGLYSGPAFLKKLKAESDRLKKLKKTLAAVKKIIADYQTALAGDSSTEVGSSDVGLDETAQQYAFRGRLAGQGALAAAQAGRMASMANRVHQPPAYRPPAYRPPMVESPRITLRVEVRR